MGGIKIRIGNSKIHSKSQAQLLSNRWRSRVKEVAK
jgi:hypothetical protein